MKYLYRTYALLVATPLFAAATIVTALAVIVAAILGDRDHTGYHAPRIWSRVTCALYLIRVRTSGREHIAPDRSYVFLANHQGYFDIFLIYGYLGHNFKWMMKEYLRKIPFVGIACTFSRQIFVGDTLPAIQKTVAQAQATLRGGMSMVIFPEGTRTHTGQMGPLKKGAFTLAKEIGLPIVPITINGSFDIFSRKARCVDFGRLTMTVHPPVTPEAQRSKPTRVLMQEVFDTINSAVEPKYRKA